MTTKHNLIVFVSVVVLGVIVGTLGTLSYPISNNITNFWPAAAIQTVSGIFFGWWGVAASVVFPMISNAITDGALSHIFGFIPANFAQSALPLLLFSRFRLWPTLDTKRDVWLFMVFCAALPHFIGGIIGCLTLHLLGNIDPMNNCFSVMGTWWIGNIPCSVLFGTLLVKYVTPALQFSGLLCSKSVALKDD